VVSDAEGTVAQLMHSIVDALSVVLITDVDVALMTRTPVHPASQDQTPIKWTIHLMAYSS